MKIDELQMANSIYNLGLTDNDFECIDKNKSIMNSSGSLYLFSKGGRAYGIQFGNHDGYNIKVSSTESVPYTPLLSMSGWEIGFIPELDCIEHIEFFINKLVSKYTHGDVPEKNKVKSISELKSRFKQAIIDRDDLADISFQELKSWFWLFDQHLPVDFDKNTLCKNRLIRKILHVFEFNNHRFSISKSKRDHQLFNIKIFNPNSAEYNYIDKGRLFVDCKYIWNDLPEKDIVPQIVLQCGESRYDFALVTKEVYESHKGRSRIEQQAQMERDKLDAALRKEIDNKLSYLAIEPFEIKGITFSQTAIKYQGQEISGTFNDFKENDRCVNSIADFIKTKISFSDETLDFNLIFETFCNCICDRLFEGILGTIHIITDKTASQTCTRYSINTFRINREEIPELLKKALCFDNVSDYNQLLHDISRCSVKHHDMLSNGLCIEYTNRELFSHETLYLKLNFVRRGSCNFLSANGKEYRIPDTNRLIGKSTLNKSARYTPTFAELTALFKEMFSMPMEEIILLFNNGLKEYKDAVRKSEQFLAEAIGLFKVQKAEKDDQSGYLVEGKSGRKYLITNDCKVFDYATMDYICIVDKSFGTGFQNDRIASRIFALANDSLVSKNISTLQRNGQVAN